MASAREGASAPGFCVIMAGGRGTRFWPLSRAQRPKHLLPLGRERSLLRETCERVVPLVGWDRLLVVTNAAQTEALTAELPELPPTHIVAEPVGRNTAPCAALGVLLAERLAGPGPVALLPADHAIPDVEAFRGQLAAAFAHAAATGQAVTFGVPPTRPETGYGYIEIDPVNGGGAAAAAPDAGPADGPVAARPQPGRRFVEKPDGATAARYVAAGNFLWNSGIFVWDSRAFREALDRCLPSLRERLAPAVAAYGTAGFARALAAAYGELSAVSLDVAVMEKLSGFAVLRAGFRWSDLGSWDAWGELAPELPGGNRGQAELFTLGASRNVVFAPGKAVALVGVDDLIVVDAGDALLVCRLRDAQRLRELTAELENQHRSDLL